MDRTMDGALSVPAPVLEELGGMQIEDPWVFMESRGRLIPWHTYFSIRGQPAGPHYKWRLLFPHSRPALLNVLARHLGWDGLGQVQLRLEDRGAVTRWVVRNLTEYGLPPEVVWDDGPCFLVELPRTVVKYRHSRLEALAVAAVWYARVARAKANGWEVRDRHHTVRDGEVHTLAGVEEYHQWPRWEVLPKQPPDSAVSVLGSLDVQDNVPRPLVISTGEQ